MNIVRLVAMLSRAGLDYSVTHNPATGTSQVSIFSVPDPPAPKPRKCKSGFVSLPCAGEVVTYNPQALVWLYLTDYDRNNVIYTIKALRAALTENEPPESGKYWGLKEVKALTDAVGRDACPGHIGRFTAEKAAAIIKACDKALPSHVSLCGFSARRA